MQCHGADSEKQTQESWTRLLDRSVKMNIYNISITLITKLNDRACSKVLVPVCQRLWGYKSAKVWRISLVEIFFSSWLTASENMGIFSVSQWLNSRRKSFSKWALLFSQVSFSFKSSYSCVTLWLRFSSCTDDTLIRPCGILLEVSYFKEFRLKKEISFVFWKEEKEQLFYFSSAPYVIYTHTHTQHKHAYSSKCGWR